MHRLNSSRNSGGIDIELRLFIEELVCDICRFVHVREEGFEPQRIRIRQEVSLTEEDAFSDIVIDLPNQQTYVVEVDYGYGIDWILASLARKYLKSIDWFDQVFKLILVVDDESYQAIDFEQKVKACIPIHWQVEIWHEQKLLALIEEYFAVKADGFHADSINNVRQAIDKAKGLLAFGNNYSNSPLDSTLLWQFGYWRLAKLCKQNHGVKRDILPPGNYKGVVVLFADLSGFSGYVRDTADHFTSRQCLSAFCAKSHYQILNDGGMVYQFLGDAVIGLFGIPEHGLDYVDQAFDCAVALLDIGESISNEWQRQLDRLQPVRGSHIGIAMGDLQILALRPFSPAHIGAIGNTINLAARLSSHAESGQIMVSNIVHRNLSLSYQKYLQESEPVDARNIGKIKAWTYYHNIHKKV